MVTTTTQPPRPVMHQSARQIAARGWSIFPCAQGEKRPLTPNGCKNATSDPGQIDAWWHQWPKANIGLATGHEKGLLVVDLDTKGGTDGLTAWAGLVADHAPGTHPGLGTLLMATPSGGVHLYLKTTCEAACRNTASTLAPGVDTRGAGGYVLTVPSHTTIGVYRRIQTAPIQPAPPWLIDLLTPTQRPQTPALVFVPPTNTSAYTNAAVAGEIDRIKNAAPGARNHTVFTASIALGQLVGGGALTENDAHAALLTAVQTHIGVDGFTQAEAETTIRSGLARGMAEPRTITPQKAS